jgi:16S rRNA U516 pseudouridylate synthase RsuA-like enzyme
MGVASRRRAEDLIQQGGLRSMARWRDQGSKPIPAETRLPSMADIHPQQRPQQHYLLLHKPLGMVSTCADPAGRPTVLDALDADLRQVGLHPVAG